MDRLCIGAVFCRGLLSNADICSSHTHSWETEMLELRTVLSTLSSGRVPVLILLAIVSLF